MRPIDAEAFLDFLRIEEKIMEDEEITFDYVRSLIVSAPTIEAKPIVHAHWEWVKIEDVDSYFELAECSNCRGQSTREYPYCRHCGAQMGEFASDTNVGSKGVKIPVISMEDVPKLAKEMKKSDG